MKKSWLTFTQAQITSYRLSGLVTDNGVVFHEEYYPDGVRLILIDEGQSKRTFLMARAELRRKRDVVGAIELAEVAIDLLEQN